MSVWDTIGAATSKGVGAAKQVASGVGGAIKDGATAAKDTAGAAVNAASDAALSAARATKDAAVTAATATKDAVVTAAAVTKDAAVVAGTAVKDGAVAAASATKDAAVATGGAIKDTASAAADTASALADDLAYGATSAWNQGVKGAAKGVTRAAKGAENACLAAKDNGFIEKCIVERKLKPSNQEIDGQYMGKDCPKSSDTPPTEGTKPKGCENSTKKFPKVIYTNGINTKPEAACATMHNIADARCVEVIGVYNASEGVFADVLNVSAAIDGARVDKASIAQSKLVFGLLDKGEPVTLYAHSEGGVNTQVGLRLTYKMFAEKYTPELANEAIKLITVYSFGTAEQGWREGPTYVQFTNRADPVPGVIYSAQASNGKPYSDPKKLTRTGFNEPYGNPFNAHSMDVAYLNALNAKFPVAKGANGKCC
jgi:hypothetical protein